MQILEWGGNSENEEKKWKQTGRIKKREKGDGKSKLKTTKK